MAIKSASEHSWTAPVDINNRRQSLKNAGVGVKGEEEGIYLGWGGIVAIWKNPPKSVTDKGGEGAKAFKSN